MGPSSGEFPLAGKPIPRSIPWESATLTGTCKQEGLVEGTVRILDMDWEWDEKEFADYPTSLEEQLKRLQLGHEQLSEQLNKNINARPALRDILAPVLMQLKEFCENAESYLIRHFDEKNPHTAESAVSKMVMPWAARLEKMDELSWKEKGEEGLCYMMFLQRSIANPGAPLPYAPIPPGTILVADTMSAIHLSNVVPHENIVGFMSGGSAGHASQEATSYGWVGISNVEGLKKKIMTGELANGTHVYMDGGKAASIWLNPLPEWVEEFHQLKSERLPENILQRIPSQYAVTRCGRPVLMSANISRTEELVNIEKVWPAGTGDVGLFRSENVLTSDKIVDQEEPQYEMYRQIVNAPHTATPIIRLVDWGGEKTKTEYTTDGSQMRDRGIRHSLLNEKTREVLRVQLRALLRASEDGPVNILVPMVTDVEEIDEVYKELQRSRQELAERGVFPPVENTSLGVMIEVGAAVGIIHDILQHVDFVNIGSGDLTQYTLAAERDFTCGGDPNYIKRFGSHHPAVINHMYEIIDAAHTHGKKVHGCGEAFAIKEYAPIVVGLDLDSISVPPNQAAGMYQEIAGLDYAACMAFVGWAKFESGGRARAVYDELERFHECVKRGELWEPPTPKQTDSEQTRPEPIVIRT